MCGLLHLLLAATPQLVRPLGPVAVYGVEQFTGGQAAVAHMHACFHFISIRCDDRCAHLEQSKCRLTNIRRCVPLQARVHLQASSVDLLLVTGVSMSSGKSTPVSLTGPADAANPCDPFQPFGGEAIDPFQSKKGPEDPFSGKDPFATSSASSKVPQVSSSGCAG